MLARSYVFADLTAWHDDPIMSEGRHQHTWRVRAYFNSEPFRDGRALRTALVSILGIWQGKDMPPELWSAEAMARALLQLFGTGDCIGIVIEREEGFGVELWL